jgi:hypothetical protein
MKYLLLLAALPIGGVVYLNATKQELNLSGVGPLLQKKGTRQLKEAGKTLLKTAETVAEVKGGASKKIFDVLKATAIKAKEQVSDKVGDVGPIEETNEVPKEDSQQVLPLEQPKESESV